MRQFLLEDCRQYGKAHNLRYAERFYYIDRRDKMEAKINDYVEKNALRTG